MFDWMKIKLNFKSKKEAYKDEREELTRRVISDSKDLLSIMSKFCTLNVRLDLYNSEKIEAIIDNFAHAADNLNSKEIDECLDAILEMFPKVEFRFGQKMSFYGRD